MGRKNRNFLRDWNASFGAQHLPGVNIDVQGLDGVAELLEQLGAGVSEQALREAARIAMRPVLTAARAKCPVESGALRDSIMMDDRHKWGARLTVGTDKVEGYTRRKDTIAGGLGLKNEHDRFYAAFVEFGTRKRAATPFLRPAFDENKFTVVRTFEQALGRIVERAIHGRMGF